MDIIKQVNNIGDVLFKKEKRFKRLGMKISREGQIIVNLPFFFPIEEAIIWVESQNQWIYNTLLKMRDEELSRKKYLIGSEYKTYNHILHIVEGNSSREGELLKLGIPSDLIEHIEGIQIQDRIRDFINSIYKEEANAILPTRVYELAKKHNFVYHKLSFRKNKSRWGSCSSGKNITLNTLLMRLPDHLINYVILHELCHTVEMNHSSAFANLLGKVCPNHNIYRNEIIKYSTIDV
jgi:predicted metal-dependent hydrolase